MDILILRDPRESPAKCSLTPLRGAPGVTFVAYRRDRRVDAGERLLLHPDGDPLGPEDRGRDLLLIDCSWRRLPRLLAAVSGRVNARALPRLVSAYPRRSKTHPDPEAGLASIEALYAATVLLGSPRPELLAGYRWERAFRAANPGLFAAPAPCAPPAPAPGDPRA